MNASSPRAAREALAAALDHNLTLGGGGPGFTEWQVRAHSRQSADMFRKAVQLALDEEGVTAVPTAAPVPPARDAVGRPWTDLVAPDGVELRAGSRQLGPWVKDDKRLDIPIVIRADGHRLIIHSRVDRTKVPGSDGRFVNVIIDIPLAAPHAGLSIVPVGSVSATEGRWPRGRPPRPLIAPHGLLVYGLSRTLRVHAPLIVSWTMAARTEQVPLGKVEIEAKFR